MIQTRFVAYINWSINVELYTFKSDFEEQKEGIQLKL